MRHKIIKRRKSMWYCTRFVYAAGLCLLIAGGLLSSCSDDEIEGMGRSELVRFNTVIEVATRTTNGGNSWTGGDLVGLFMLQAGGEVTHDVIPGAENIPYRVDPETGVLSPNVWEPIYYPEEGVVDFIAYYPFTAMQGTASWHITADYAYNISFQYQMDVEMQNTIDLLYAKTTNRVKSMMPVTLTFCHVFSKISFNITMESGSGSLSGHDIEYVLLSNMPEEAMVILQNGMVTAGKIGHFPALEEEMPSGGADATYTALIVPQPDGGMGRNVIFYIGGEEFIWNIPDSETFGSGVHYIYPVTVSKGGIKVGTATIAGWNQRDNGTGVAEMLTVPIKPGTFRMGQTSWGSPDHEVTLTKGFRISKYLVTKTQYAEFLNACDVEGVEGSQEIVRHEVTGYGKRNLFVVKDGLTPVWNSTKQCWEATGEIPMVNVTWFGAKVYADWVGGSLPTEAQWEYACRGGTTTDFSFGDDEADLAMYGWFRDNSPVDSPSPVGMKLPNPWGIYDMHGNVFEWCKDWYDNYDTTSVVDPVGAIDPDDPDAGSTRVLRGGSWDSPAFFCYSSYRNFFPPADTYENIGFRVIFAP